MLSNFNFKVGKFYLTLLSVVLMVFADPTVAQLDCSRDPLDLGARIFSNVNMGDDESAFLCAIKGVELMRDSTVTVSNLISNKHPLWNGMRPANWPGSVLKQIHHFDNVIYYLLVGYGASLGTPVLDAKYDFKGLVADLATSDQTKPLLQRSLVRFKDIKADFPKGYWLRGLCHSFQLQGVNIGGVPFDLQTTFTENGPKSFMTVVERLAAGDQIGNYGDIGGEPIYTSCWLSQLTMSASDGAADRAVNIASTPKILAAVLRRTASEELPTAVDNRIATTISDANGAAKIEIALAETKDKRQYVTRITYTMDTSRITALEEAAQRVLDSLHKGDASNLDRF